MNLDLASLTWIVPTVASATSIVPVEPQATPFSLGKVVTFLFLTLGPFKIIAPFAEMTRGRAPAFKRELALRGTLHAALGLLAAATAGAYALRKWEISVGALQLTAGLLLFLVALRAVMEQYGSGTPGSEAGESDPAATEPASRLAISPLAFPTIVTPWGLAVLIILVTLRTGAPTLALQLFGVTVAVLAVNLLAMLGAERVLKVPFVGTGLAIVGMVLAVLQVALGVQAIAGALPMLGLAGSAGALLPLRS